MLVTFWECARWWGGVPDCFGVEVTRLFVHTSDAGGAVPVAHTAFISLRIASAHACAVQGHHAAAGAVAVGQGVGAGPVILGGVAVEVAGANVHAPTTTESAYIVLPGVPRGSGARVRS